MRVLAFACLVVLAPCTGHQVRSYGSTAVVATSPEHVVALMSEAIRYTR
jgi:hypothetical protein